MGRIWTGNLIGIFPRPNFLHKRIEVSMGTFLILAFGLVFYILGLPWWSLFPCAFFIGLGEARQNEEGRGRRAFAMGLVGGGIVWVGSSDEETVFDPA